MAIALKSFIYKSVVTYLCLALFFDTSLCFAETIIPQGAWKEWQEHSFNGNTKYQPGVNGTLKASCENTASALYYETEIDLTKTPIMRWAWKVDDVHTALHENEKAGDDYPARIYAIYTPSNAMPWRTKTMNYVWANSQQKNSAWPNAFTNHAMMLALQSGTTIRKGKWVEESRNIWEDFKIYFGLDLDRIDGIAIMTDCDNAGLPMTGYYKNIRFTAE